MYTSIFFNEKRKDEKKRMYTGDRFRSCDLWIISHNHPLDEPRVVESKGTMFYSALPLSYTGKTSCSNKGRADHSAGDWFRSSDLPIMSGITIP